MNKTIAILIVTLFVFALASVSFAADAKKADPSTAPAVEKKTAPAAEAKKAPENLKKVTGEVVAADAKAKTITVKGEKGNVVITVDEKVLAKVKAGDKVVVKYTEADGKNTAKSLKKATAKMAEKTKKEKAAPAQMETK